jgi:hypothetical protein
MVEQFDRMEYDMDCEQSGDPIEWETVSYGSTPFLHYANAALDVGDVFAVAGQIDPRSIGHGMYQCL